MLKWGDALFLLFFLYFNNIKKTDQIHSHHGGMVKNFNRKFPIELKTLDQRLVGVLFSFVYIMLIIQSFFLNPDKNKKIENSYRIFSIK